MAISFEQLKTLVAAERLKFFVDPENPRLILGITGMCGKYQMIISLYEEGAFLQFRTVNYLYCPAKHPALTEVLKAIADINYQTRLVKFAWDQSDGEIVAYADLWVMDTTVTQAQLNRMIGNFVPVIDIQFYRLERTLKEGRDPGRVDPAVLMSRMIRDAALPPELRELLEGKKDEDVEAL